MRNVLLVFLCSIPYWGNAKFKIKYEKPKVVDYLTIYDFLKSNHELLLGVSVSYWNDCYNIPVNVNIVLSECGLVDSRYNVQGKKIFICYESIWNKVMTLKGKMPNEKIVDLIRHSAIFTLNHEMGHAMIDLLEINNSPDKRTNELLADEFATYSLFKQLGKEHDQTIWLNASYFKIKATEANRSNSPIAPLSQKMHDLQRHQLLAVFLLGHNSNRNTERNRKLLGIRMNLADINQYSVKRTNYWKNKFQEFKN